MALLPSNLSTLSREDLIAALIAAQDAKRQKITCKVTEKGALSLYGLGRFPVTLYKSQWESLLSNVEMIREALIVNASKLTTKE